MNQHRTLSFARALWAATPNAVCCSTEARLSRLVRRAAALHSGFASHMFTPAELEHVAAELARLETINACAGHRKPICTTATPKAHIPRRTMQWWQVELFVVVERTWQRPQLKSVGFVNALWSSRQKAEAYAKKHNIELGAPKLPPQNTGWLPRPAKLSAPANPVFAIVKQGTTNMLSAAHILPYTNPLEKINVPK